MAIARSAGEGLGMGLQKLGDMGFQYAMALMQRGWDKADAETKAKKLKDELAAKNLSSAEITKRYQGVIDAVKKDKPVAEKFKVGPKAGFEGPGKKTEIGKGKLRTKISEDLKKDVDAGAEKKSPEETLAEFKAGDKGKLMLGKKAPESKIITKERAPGEVEEEKAGIGRKFRLEATGKGLDRAGDIFSKDIGEYTEKGEALKKGAKETAETAEDLRRYETGEKTKQIMFSEQQKQALIDNQMSALNAGISIEKLKKSLEVSDWRMKGGEQLQGLVDGWAKASSAMASYGSDKWIGTGFNPSGYETDYDSDRAAQNAAVDIIKKHLKDNPELGAIYKNVRPEFTASIAIKDGKITKITMYDSGYAGAKQIEELFGTKIREFGIDPASPVLDMGKTYYIEGAEGEEETEDTEGTDKLEAQLKEHEKFLGPKEMKRIKELDEQLYGNPG